MMPESMLRDRYFPLRVETFPALITPGITASRSKPEFSYPIGENSPIGKGSVIPDFMFTLEGRRYEIIEIERSGQQTAKRSGQQSAETT